MTSQTYCKIVWQNDRRTDGLTYLHTTVIHFQQKWVFMVSLLNLRILENLWKVRFCEISHTKVSTHKNCTFTVDQMLWRQWSGKVFKRRQYFRKIIFFPRGFHQYFTTFPLFLPFFPSFLLFPLLFLLFPLFSPFFPSFSPFFTSVLHSSFHFFSPEDQFFISFPPPRGGGEFLKFFSLVKTCLL